MVLLCCIPEVANRIISPLKHYYLISDGLAPGESIDYIA